MRNLPRTTQFSLFHPPSRCPSWESLPVLFEISARIMRQFVRNNLGCHQVSRGD
jgi:hypothetical protein